MTRLNEFFSAAAARIDRWRTLNRVANALASGEGTVQSLRAVPWMGFPLGCAVSGFPLTVFGYIAMVMTK